MRMRRWAGWAAVGACVLYGGFAFTAAGAVLAGGDSGRSAPPLFVIHAVAGGVALIAGAAQLRLGRPPGNGVHRLLGRTYVISAWVTAAGSLGVAASFDAGVAGRVALGLGAVLWFVSTTVAYRRIRAGRAAEHRRWAVRSFALAFFFVTFSLWVPLFAATPQPEAVGYPVAVVLSWGLNLAAAETWIRRSGPARRAVPVRRPPAARAPARR